LDTLDEVGREVGAAYLRAGVPHQGMICDTVLIARERLADFLDEDAPLDPENLAFDLLDFAKWALEEARLLPGEFSCVAMGSMAAHLYVSAVFDGGHRGYLENYGWNPASVAFCKAALNEMGAVDYLDVVRRADVLLRPLSKEIEEAREWGASRLALPDGLAALDLAMRAMTDERAHYATHGEWALRAARFHSLGPDELKARKNDVVGANPHPARGVYLVGM